MRKNFFSALLLSFSLCFLFPFPGYSGALDQLLSISGGSMPNVPEPGEPQPVEPQTAEPQSSGSGGIFNFFSRPEPTYEEIQARNKRREERRQARERARKKAEQESRDRARREKKEKERKAWPKGLPPKRSQYSYTKPARNSLATFPTMPAPGDELKTIQEVSLKIKSLRAKKNLSFEEKQALFNLEEFVRKLWLQSVNSQSGNGNRQKLIVPVNVSGSASYKGAVVLTSNQINNLKSPSVNKPGTVIDPIAAFYQEKTGQLIEMKAEEYANKISGGESHFAEVLAVGKTALSIAERDYAGAAAETINYFIGKIPYPQAQLAAEGGKIYARTSFQALNHFMNSAMGAVGGKFDQKQFWQELKNELNPAQKAFLKWVEDPSK